MLLAPVPVAPVARLLLLALRAGFCLLLRAGLLGVRRPWLGALLRTLPTLLAGLTVLRPGLLPALLIFILSGAVLTGLVVPPRPILPGLLALRFLLLPWSGGRFRLRLFRRRGLCFRHMSGYKTEFFLFGLFLRFALACATSSRRTASSSSGVPGLRTTEK